MRSRSFEGAAYPAEFFASGGSSLDPRVVEAAGGVSGSRLLHLMCSTGEETLSWSVLGAVATGVDISPRQVELAAAKAGAAGLDTRFVAADICALPAGFGDGAFDIVYTASGVLVWIPDVARWARVIAHALRPGGRLILFEEHPVSMCLSGEGGRIEIVDDYFDTGHAIESGGWSHFEGADDAQETSYEFGWTLGDIVTSLAGAGLRIDRLTEYPSEAVWRFGDALEAARRLPGRYLLIASREGQAL